MLLFLAVSLHVWGVRSPEPQEPVYAMLASRLVASVLVSPPLPLAPPLRPIMSQRWSAGRRVTIQTSVLNVPPVPGPPVSSPAVDPRLVAVGTSGTTIGWATDTPDVAPRLAPAAPPARATLDDSPSLAVSAESRPAPMIAAFTTIDPLREPRIQSTAPSLDGLALSASRVALPADRKEADPTDPADEQGRQTEVVLAVVREYTRALERLDVHATKAVYPSVDDRRLRRSFEDVETQRFQLALLRRVLFLIGTRRQRVVSWQFDVPAQNWIASPPIHGSGVGVQPSAGWGRMADSRGADSVDDSSQPAGHERKPAAPAPSDTAASPPVACPECAHPCQTLVSQGDVVSIYRCPICGHLSAPVKER